MAIEPSPEAVKDFVLKHDVDPDYGMQHSMHCAYMLYTIISGIPRDQGMQKTQLNKLARKAKQLVKAIDEFDAALGGFDELSQNPAVSPIELRRDVTRQKKQVQLDADKWARSADSAYAGIGKLKTGGGDPAFNDLLDLLIDVYAAGTGEEPTYPSTDASHARDTRGGPMFGFITGCLDLLQVDKKTNEARGSAIDRILDDRKK